VAKKIKICLLQFSILWRVRSYRTHPKSDGAISGPRGGRPHAMDMFCVTLSKIQEGRLSEFDRIRCSFSKFRYDLLILGSKLK
jgi:hypothetical protein